MQTSRTNTTPDLTPCQDPPGRHTPHPPRAHAPTFMLACQHCQHGKPQHSTSTTTAERQTPSDLWNGCAPHGPPFHRSTTYLHRRPAPLSRAIRTPPSTSAPHHPLTLAGACLAAAPRSMDVAAAQHGVDGIGGNDRNQDAGNHKHCLVAHYQCKDDVMMV